MREKKSQYVCLSIAMMKNKHKNKKPKKQNVKNKQDKKIKVERIKIKK